MAGKSHLHKYQKVKLKATKKLYVLQCRLSNCSHYIHYDNRTLLIGKQAICNRCLEPFEMNEKHVNQAKPHCDNCIVRHPSNVFAKRSGQAKQFVEGKLSDLLSKAIQGNDE